MNKLEKIEDVVFEVLSESIKSRGDDFILYGNVLKKMGINVKVSLFELFKNHDFYNLPAFESVTRARRKIQAKNFDLAAPEVVAKRKALEAVYKEFARK